METTRGSDARPTKFFVRQIHGQLVDNFGFSGTLDRDKVFGAKENLNKYEANRDKSEANRVQFRQ